jgi:hypothetical protein
MHTASTARAGADQASFLDAALRSGKRISLDVLLPLEWKLPPGNDRDPRPGDPFYLPTAAQRRADGLLFLRNPGLLVTAAECEAAKYEAPWPNDDAPLREHVGRYLLHVRGKWSYHVWGERQQALTFKKYLADYVGDRLGIGCYLAGEPAAQLLRLATGRARGSPAASHVVANRQSSAVSGDAPLITTAAARNGCNRRAARRGLKGCVPH